MNMKMRVGAIIGAMIVALVGLTASPVSAGVNNSVTRCTVDLGNGYQVCQKVFYVDNGSRVQINQMEFFVKNGRTGATNDGWKAENFWLSCYSAGGTKIYPIDHRFDSYKVASDSSGIIFSAGSNNCGEADVRFGGYGVKVIQLNPDKRDDFGDGYSQLTVD